VHYRILLCADSQLTTGYTKHFKSKIDTIIFQNNLTIAATGSGESDYVDTAISKITQGLMPSDSVGKIEVELKDRLLSFFDESLSRWAYYSDRDRPTVELLIAVTGAHISPALFHYSGTAFCRVPLRYAIGSGVLLADDLIQRYMRKQYTVEQAANFAVFIMKQVKDSVDGCGGTTHLVGLRRGGDLTLSEDNEISTAEAHFDALVDSADKELATQILNRTIPFKWFKESFRKKKKPENAT
jgi:hypothetical protein